MNASIGVRTQGERGTGAPGALERLERPPALAFEPAIDEFQPRGPGRAGFDPVADARPLLPWRAAFPSGALRACRRRSFPARRLSSGFPGTIAGPPSPPLNAPEAVASDRLALRCRIAVTMDAAPFEDRSDPAAEEVVVGSGGRRHASKRDHG